jgi:putative DNA primase/helicase
VGDVEDKSQERKSAKYWPLTDIGNASFFADRHSKDLHYNHLSRKWLIWDGKRWREDNSGEIMEKAKQVAREMMQNANNVIDEEKRKKFMDHAYKTQYESRLGAMVRLARSVPEIPVTPEKLDSDPWLVNLQNGTLDLKSGALVPHRREDLITKIIPISYNPYATCPTWDQFLQRVTDHNPDLIRFLQKGVGYSLTGDATEHVIFILHGTGANGKSTFISTILSLLGDYGRQTPTETLLTKRGSGIPNDVARLRGARFVSAVESEGGKQLAETLVKQLTGGDRMAARFLYGEYFEFEVTFKIFLAANHKPAIKGSDYAIWRRIRLIPFRVTIPPEERDKSLMEKLRKEMPGILRWAVDGCLLWQREGLKPPEFVRAATAEYRLEMDKIGDFISECCEISEGAKTAFGDLYAVYCSWCAKNQEKDIGKKDFARCLDEHGFMMGRNKALGRYREGITLKTGDAKSPETDGDADSG